MHFSKPVSFNGWFQQRCFLKLLMKEDPKIEAIGLSTADEASLPSEDEINRGCISIIWTPLKIQKLRDCWVFFSFFFFFLKTKLFTSSKESNYSEVRNSYQRWKSPPPRIQMASCLEMDSGLILTFVPYVCCSEAVFV